MCLNKEYTINSYINSRIFAFLKEYKSITLEIRKLMHGTKNPIDRNSERIKHIFSMNTSKVAQ